MPVGPSWQAPTAAARMGVCGRANRAAAHAPLKEHLLVLLQQGTHLVVPLLTNDFILSLVSTPDMHCLCVGYALCMAGVKCHSSNLCMRCLLTVWAGLTLCVCVRVLMRVYPPVCFGLGEAC